MINKKIFMCLLIVIVEVYLLLRVRATITNLEVVKNFLEHCSYDRNYPLRNFNTTIMYFKKSKIKLVYGVLIIIFENSLEWFLNGIAFILIFSSSTK